MTTSLPKNYTARPATLDDVDIAVELVNARSIALIGKPHADADEFRNEWQQPTFNLETDTRLVFNPEGKLVGYAGLWDSEPHVKLYGWADVHPEWQDHGIGTYLNEWIQARAQQAVPKAPEDARVVLAQSKWEIDKAGCDFVQSQGYKLTRYFLRMRIEMDAPPPEAVFPEGIIIRTFAVAPEARDTWLRAIVETDREAFKDHWGYVEHPPEEEFTEWKHWIDNKPDHDPSLWFLAMDGDEIVALSLCDAKTTEEPDMAYVDTLCVRREWRRKGIALGMLHHTFGEFYQRGTRKVSLHVAAASLTGATLLYEKAGMYAERKSINYEKELRPGKDLSTQNLNA
jgi:ribosomal protein S18 acetylase RimI-like enzyme